MCYINKTLNDSNLSFEEKIKKIDETQFDNLKNSKFDEKIDMDNFINNWLNKEGSSKSREDTEESYCRKVLSNN